MTWSGRLVRPAYLWLGGWLVALLLDYPLAQALLRKPHADWGVLRRSYVDTAHILGQGWMLLVIGGLIWFAGALMSRVDWQRVARWFAGALLITGFWAQAIKHVAGRPRPSQLAHGAWLPIGPTFQPSFDSFPSGHAMTVFAAVPLLCALWPRGRWFVIVAATLVALGRVAGGSHYLSDLVVGAGMGLAIGRYLTARWRAEVESTDAL